MNPLLIETYKDDYGNHRWRVVLNGDVRLDGFPAYHDKSHMMAIIKTFVSHIKPGTYTITSEPKVRKKWN